MVYYWLSIKLIDILNYCNYLKNINILVLILKQKTQNLYFDCSKFVLIRPQNILILCNI